jgi:transcriptional regulator with XRE-family HTH domain
MSKSLQIAPDGTALRSRRESLFLSRQALGSRAGLSAGTIANIESGRHRPQARTLQALLRALHIPDALIGEGEPQKTVRVGITDLRAARALTDPAMHPERRDEAQRVSATLDHLIEVAEQKARL